MFLSVWESAIALQPLLRMYLFLHHFLYLNLKLSIPTRINETIPLVMVIMNVTYHTLAVTAILGMDFPAIGLIPNTPIWPRPTAEGRCFHSLVLFTALVPRAQVTGRGQSGSASVAGKACQRKPTERSGCGATV